MKLFLTLTMMSFFTLSIVKADDSVKKQTQEAAHDAKRSVKKTTRKIQDKSCELINGKMECAAKKVKHSMQNAADKVEDAID